MLIGIVVHEHAVASGLFALTEMLIAANRLTKRACFAVEFVAVRPGPHTLCIGGGELLTTVEVTRTLDSDEIDCLVLPGLWDRYGQRLDSFVESCTPLVDAVRALPVDAQLLGYCTSVCVLAEAGRLDGREATATWWMARSLQQRHPDVAWQFDQSTVFTDTVGTVSGANGYLGVAQHLVERQLGPEIWRELDELLLLPAPKASNEPFAELKLAGDQSATVKKLRAWAKRTPAAAAQPGAAAAFICTSTRTASRHLQAETGLTLGRFLRVVKLMQACDLLKHSAMTVEAIADRLGYADTATLRRAFRRETRLTPVEFRTVYGRNSAGSTRLP